MPGATTPCEAEGVPAAPLTGRVAMVTGAGAGIGRGISRALAQAGATVVVNDIDEAAATSAACEIRSTGGRASAFAADVGDAASVDEMVGHIVQGVGTIDILVNNVGIGHDPVPIESLRTADIDRRYQVNLRSHILLARAALPAMRANGWGRIVNIGSRSWLGASGQSDYAALKAAVIGFTRSLALEVGADRITVNAVVPGSIRTPAFDRLGETTVAQLLSRHPARRFGSVDDIGRAVVFFASPAARALTAQVLHVCGGRSLYGGPIDLPAATDPDDSTHQSLGGS
jgi:2-[hydroxy(phenyl)methyl]-succinyl-CoA dehydrogenase BbsD subunit